MKRAGRTECSCRYASLNRVCGRLWRKAHLGRGVDSEAELGLLAIVHREALQQKGAKAGAGASSHSIEHQEALQTCRTAAGMTYMHRIDQAAMPE